jgi:hypothetical protein
MSNFAITNPVKVMAGKLLGEFSLITSDGLLIPGMRLLEERDGTHWVTFPCKEYTKPLAERAIFGEEAGR